MLSFFIYFLILIVPGFISVPVYELAANRRIRTCCRTVAAAFIFDLLIVAVNFAGLYFLKDIITIDTLLFYFGHLRFTVKYAVLAIVVGIILALIAGTLYQLYLFRKNCMHGDKSQSK